MAILLRKMAPKPVSVEGAIPVGRACKITADWPAYKGWPCTVIQASHPFYAVQFVDKTQSRVQRRQLEVAP